MAENIEFKLNVVENKLDKALESATQKTFSLSRALESAVGNFTASVAIKGFELLSDAIGATTDFLFDSVDAAAESQAAFKKLEVALGQTGQATKENLDEFDKLAAKIQETTAFEDDAVIASAALIQTLGRLNKDGLKEATGAATDLAAALGIDLESASQLVGKAATGNVTAFQKLGIEIKKGSTDAETFANTLKVLNDRFGGAAAAQVNTFTGATTQLKNVFDDLKETIGGLIVNNPAVIAAFNTVKNLLLEIGKSITSSFGSTQEEAISNVFKAFIDGVAFSLTAFDALFRGVDFAVNSIIATFKVLALGIQGPITAVLTLASSIPGVGESFKQAAEDSLAEMERLQDGAENAALKANEAFSGDTFLSRAVDKVGELRVGFDLLEADAKKAQETISNSGGNAVGGGEVDQAQIDKEKQLQAEIANIRAVSEAEQDFMFEQKSIERLDNKALQDQLLIDAELAKNLKLIEAQYQLEEQKALIETDAAKKSLLLQKANAIREAQTQKALGESSIKNQKLTAEQEKQIQNSRLQALSGFLNAGLTLAKQGSAEAKALQSATAVVSTYTAANQALSSPPGPPFTYPLVASVIAQGLANVSKINSQKFAQGGLVSGASETGDKIPANLNAREMVLTQEQQANLFNQINSGGGSSGDIIIQIDGLEIARAVRNQIRGGFSLV